MKGNSIRAKLTGYAAVSIIFSAAVVGVSLLCFWALRADGTAAFWVVEYYPPILIALFASLIVVSALMARRLLRMRIPIEKVSELALRIAEGKSIVRYTHNEDNEFGTLAVSVNKLLEYIISRTDMLKQINEGDYSARIEPLGEVDKLTKAIINVIDTNNEILSEIKNAAHGINVAAGQVEHGAYALAGGSSEQAATIEQLSAVMSELLAMANQNAEVARATLKDAIASREIMESSSADIEKMMLAMDSITASSHRIETITKVIDDIAFQTNILALNAAVEAARAGVHGRGFAVVADEVRVLATKSATAAKETSELIQTSIASVNEGNAIVHRTAESLADTGAHATDVAENMGRLSEASEQQRQSIAGINDGIAQVSNIIQSNSMMAQQNSASAQEMTAQSEALESLVARFKLRSDEPPDNAIP